MQDLMAFSTVSELLTLDPRDEKRNRLLLSAVSEEICLYLDRNLLSGTTTEIHSTDHQAFFPIQYPVREFLEIVDATTNKPIPLTADSVLPDLQSPDAHLLRSYRIQAPADRNIRITYRYGYTQTEFPSLIQACVLALLTARLSPPTDKNTPERPNPLDTIIAYRRKTI